MLGRAIERIDPYTKFTENLFLVLAVFTCTFFIYRDFGLRMMFGYAVLCLILALHFVRRVCHNRPLQLSPVKIALLFLCLVIFLNFLRPASRHDSDSFSYVISMLVCCVCVLFAAPGEREGRKVLQVFYISAALMAVYVLFFAVFPNLFWNSIYQILSETAREYLAYYVPKGYSITIGGCTYTNYILYLGMAACCGYLASASRWDRKRTVMLISCGVFLFSILLVGRRGELLGAVACCLLLVFVTRSGKQRKYLLLIGIGAIALLFLLVVLFLPQLKKVDVLYRYVMTVENLISGKDITSGRTELYALAFDAFLKHPVLGIGWDQFHTLIPQEFLAVHGADVEDVHCIYLQFLCETGLVGAPLVIAPLAYCYYQVCAQFSRLKKRAADSDRQNTAFRLCVTSFMLQSFLLFMGIYDPNFQRVVFWCFYALSVLLLISALGLEEHAPGDAVSRFLCRVIRWISPPFLWIWRKLSVLSKEDPDQ